MPTTRTIELALHLLRRSGYGTFNVRPEHHRLCDYDRTFTGTVATWVINMPRDRRDQLIDTLADRADSGTFYEAERLNAMLPTILTGDGDQAAIAAIATQRTCTTAYAARLDALTADLAYRALAALHDRYSECLGAVQLLDVGHQAHTLLTNFTIPPPGRDPVTDPIARALRAAVAHILAEHDEVVATATVINAVKEAGW